MRLSFSLLWISDDRGQSLVAEDCPLVRQGVKYATVEHHPAEKLWRGRTISNPEIVLTGKTADAVKVQCESLIEAWATARQNCITLTLQWPPSVNHYWRTARGVHYISAQIMKPSTTLSMLHIPPVKLFCFHLNLHWFDRRRLS